MFFYYYTTNSDPFLRHLKLENFMGFQEWEHDFYPLTILAGNNTSGKTTVLNGIQVALGAILQSLDVLPGNRLFRRQIQEDERYSPFDSFSKGYKPSSGQTRVSALSGIRSANHVQGLEWSRELIGSTTSHNRRNVGDLQDWVRSILKQREEEEEAKFYSEKSVLPLLLSFGTNRLASQVRFNKSTKERMTRLERAYKAALTDKVDFAGAHQWFLESEKNIQEGREFKGTRDAFVKALMTAIPYISNVGVNWAYGELEAEVQSGLSHKERHCFSQMSDGFKAMINLVSEIAHRCIELNGFLGEKSVIMTKGIVLIDEIDIYLHPKWQRHVLADLRQAFPLIQFVVTTHSPFIIQSASRQQLISLDNDVCLEGDPEKESLEEIVIRRMGMEKETVRSERFNLMVQRAEKFYQLVKDGSDAEKDEELKKLEEEFLDDPAYIALLRAERKCHETCR